MTPYQDINEILSYMANSIQSILGKNLVGLYLFGSLSYGDFNPNSSDIDLITVLAQPLNNCEIESIKQLHLQIGDLSKKWIDRLECSYTPIYMFENILPPKEPRPYYGGAIFYEKAPYGNEWIINNYLIYQHGISLIGPEFKKLIKPIDIIEVQRACIRDLFQEWEPKIIDPGWLDNSHYQSYIVMNLCRILYTVLQGVTGTKKTSAEWVKKRFGLPWINLIKHAANWEYGKTLFAKNETINFIRFCVNEVKQTEIYKQMLLKNSIDSVYKNSI